MGTNESFLSKQMKKTEENKPENVGEKLRARRRGWNQVTEEEERNDIQIPGKGLA